MSGRIVAPDIPSAAEACARHIMAVLDPVLTAGGTATLALSGGGTAKYLFEKALAADFPWQRVHLFWVDERCVPPADPASNFGFADEHFLRPAGIPPERVHRIHGELPPETAAAEYAREIRDFFGTSEGSFPSFDCLHLGIGPDAHNASLFPGDPLIDDRTGIAAATYSQKFSQWRVTLLPAVLLAARHTVFLAVGADKQAALRSVFDDPYNPKQFPAQLVARGGMEVTWFLDEAATGFLD